jgi:hypothetical protein
MSSLLSDTITVQSYIPDTPGLDRVEFSWSGARDLNPGPHGPEPWRGHVLRCPTDSRVALANAKPTRLVSFGDPEDPADSGRL